MSQSRPTIRNAANDPSTSDLGAGGAVKSLLVDAPQTEARPFPPLANRALALLIADYERQLNALIAEAADAVGASAEDGWRADVQRRRFVRAAPPTPTD